MAKERRHGQKCECDPCLGKRLKEFKDRIAHMSDVRMPGGLSQTISVRAHWRRSSNHLRHSPKLRALVQDIVRGLIK